MPQVPLTVELDPETLLTAHGDDLYRYALSRLRDPHAAEDMVQETFLAALADPERFRGESSPRTWLTGILRHKICDHLRRRCRERPTAGDDELHDPVCEDMFIADGHFRHPPQEWQRDPAAQAQDREFWEVYNRCLKSLPSRQAAAFTLRELEQQAPEQVCQELELTATNLWVLLHRARLRLRACLEQRWFT
jgi:RNA polymerase sigma-70 factor, ECF subfamily